MISLALTYAVARAAYTSYTAILRIDSNQYPVEEVISEHPMPDLLIVIGNLVAVSVGVGAFFRVWS